MSGGGASIMTDVIDEVTYMAVDWISVPRMVGRTDVETLTCWNFLPGGDESRL